MPYRRTSFDTASQALPSLEDHCYGSLSTFQSLKDYDMSRLSLSEFLSSPNSSDFGSVSSVSNGSNDIPRHLSQKSAHTHTLNVAFTISFTKGDRLFKLRYRQVTLDNNADGTLRCLKLHDDAAAQSPLVHSFPYSASPMPHVEQPYHGDAKGPFVTSFLGEQIVQIAQVVFSAQPHYSFDDWQDCIAFQQALFREELVFVAGMLRAKSKGRGEECISQNLRIVQSRTGQRTLIFFANAQRPPYKRYVTIPYHAIDEFDRHKRSKDRVTIKISPNASETLTSMKNLTIDFLEANDKAHFLTFAD